MDVPMFVLLPVVCLLLCLALFWRLGWFPIQPCSSRAGVKRITLRRLLKPRCPDDCPACRLGSPPSSGAGPAPVPVRPWPEVKSRRGAPKRIDTQGFACPNHLCPYRGITDAHIHALVGDGKHGRLERIQTFRCQACQTTFTSRRNTPLFRLKTPSRAGSQWCSPRWLKGWIRSRCRTGLRLPAGDYHHLAVPRWRTCADLTPARFLDPPAPARAVG